MSDIALVYTTFPDADSAQAVAQRMIEDNFAACANVMAGCVSIYRWEEGVAQDVETPVLFKTATDRAEALRDEIVQLHPYDLPVIEIWPAAVMRPVAEWVDESVRD
ncbi:divalent-cation tolerance protein CutA [Stakelama saccharophila]|uniref:Divalent cation tolerance protein CutA n=1 Tax=Stakelama saccharophila TaxID=3075605 RepID=A0ABZ0B7Z7_9SPHN|nr:divalent cation tolerance protein CutA [Stakelama sp. W311]WNO53236.1 divalent cation tolerance protein CutA [Stakelama sp. W311]